MLAHSSSSCCREQSSSKQGGRGAESLISALRTSYAVDDDNECELSYTSHHHLHVMAIFIHLTACEALSCTTALSCATHRMLDAVTDGK